MQQSIQRMSGQVQAMQQEVRELSQIAQQLYQQHTGHFQQLQGQMMQNNQIYQLAGNEQASANLLKILTDVCTEMNQHLRTISQQVTGNAVSMGGTPSGMGQRHAMSAGQGTNQPGMLRSMNQSGVGGASNQPIAPEGPLNTINRAAVPGMDRRMTSQIGDTNNNQLQGVGSSDGAGFSAVSDTSSTASMVSSTQVTNMNTGWNKQSQAAAGAQTAGQKGNQSAAMMSNQGGQQGSQPGTQAQMTAGTQSQASMSPYHGYQQPSGQQGSQVQMTSGSTAGTMSSLSAQNKNSSNEYREEPNATNYPYNRYTT